MTWRRSWSCEACDVMCVRICVIMSDAHSVKRVARWVRVFFAVEAGRPFPSPKIIREGLSCCDSQ